MILVNNQRDVYTIYLYILNDGNIKYFGCYIVDDIKMIIKAQINNSLPVTDFNVRYG